MNLFELFVKVGVDDQASNNLKSITSKLGNGLKTAAKIGTAAVTTAAAGIAALTGAAVKNYAEYEQLVGGVDTLFKNASKKVQQYASEAYRTSGMSANDYMANATAFSASLISSLGGDTEKAAEYANRAMVSMSDNANKMGTSIDSIVQTYQSLSRGNLAMLDNLKLGYGGSKAELERLIADAASYTDIQKEMGVAVDASSMSFDNIVNAIAVVQGKLGIAGATAQEAGTTIEGSVNSMKAAWENLVTGFANESADIGLLIDDLVTTIVGDGTDANLGVIGNVLPAVQRALGGIGKLIEGAVPVLIEMLPGLLEQIIPTLISSATSLVDAVIEVLPELVDLIVDALIDNAPMLIVAAVELILALAGGLISAVPKLLKAIPEIISETVNAFKNSENIKKFIEVGKNIIEGIKSGIKKAWSNLVSWFKGLFGDLIGIAKKILGIKSPSRVFRDQIGKQMAAGLGLGWEDEFGKVKDDIEDSLAFDDASVGINASVRKIGAGAAGMAYGGTSIGNITINIDGARYSDEQSLAAAIAQEIQSMTDRRAAVYA